MSFIQDNASTCFFIVGDFNADVSVFAKHVVQFCSDNGYTYVSDAWHTTSWLDHFICTANAHDSIEAVRVDYEFATTDHVPSSLAVDMDCVPAQIPVDNN